MLCFSVLCLYLFFFFFFYAICSFQALPDAFLLPILRRPCHLFADFLPDFACAAPPRFCRCCADDDAAAGAVAAYR